MNKPSYFAALTLAQVEACALEAERLSQQDPHVVPARVAAAWAVLVELMNSAGASAVRELGHQATADWQANLGFSPTSETWDDDWPRDRPRITEVRRGSEHTD